MNEKEYIERERYCDMNKFAQAICEDMTLTEEEANKFISLLWQQTTADVAEVKHGEWIFEYKESTMHYEANGYRCSLCSCVEEMQDKKPYCPNCGAIMKRDGKQPRVIFCDEKFCAVEIVKG